MNKADKDLDGPRKDSPGFVLAGIAGVLVSAILLTGLAWRQHADLRDEEIARKESLQQGRIVRVATAQKAPDVKPVVLVGEARPFASVTLYAKISGYVQEIRVDKGDQVRADQIIAVLDSPELNKQYAAAVADAKNKRADAERARYLLKSGSMSAQNAETVETAAKVSEDNAAAIEAQKDYGVMRAPFDGTITARYADPGALLQAATTSQTNSLPLATLAQTDHLRVYVYPDQKTASAVRVGDRAEVSDITRQKKKLSATVTRTSGELDPKTRTLLVEIDLKNEDGLILAGSFVQVTLFIRVPPTIAIPAGTLVMRHGKPYVAVVNNDDKVNFRSIDIYESDGRQMRIASGLSEGERVIISPGERFAEGDKVQPRGLGDSLS
jgi:RND family efflux transporter MFP subunit